MRVLLDTSVFIWFIEDHPRLSTRAVDVLGDLSTDVYVSTASLWEMAIKAAIGKLVVEQPLVTVAMRNMSANDLEIMNIMISHIATVATLPLHHRDPFDRMLIAQAVFEQMPIISADSAFDAYPVERIW